MPSSPSFRVLLSAYACRPDAGSEPGIGWNWAFHLPGAGCEVHLFTAARNREAIEAYLLQHPCPGLHPHYVEVPFLNPLKSDMTHYILWQSSMLRQARTLLRTIPMDIVHHVSYGSVHIPTTLWRLGLPTIFGPVGGGQTPPASLVSYFGSSGRRERLRTRMTSLLPKFWLYRSRMQRMRLILAANSETLNLVKAAGCPSTRLLCDTGVRLDFRAPSSRLFTPALPIRLLWVGRFLPRKGLALAFDALAKTHAPIHLTILGDGIAPSSMDRLIAQRGLEGRVHWEGQRLPWMQVREAYATHDALLFTSLRDSFGSQNLEAMCVGLPIIALNLSGARDFIPPAAAIKVDVRDTADATVAALAEAMDHFAALPLEQRNAMSQAAWAGSAKFFWSGRAAYAAGLYRELLDADLTPA